MNKFDYLIQQKLRAKYFRAPKIEEIKLKLRLNSWEGTRLIISIGKEYRRCKTFIPENETTINTLEKFVNYFNKCKKEKWLRSICQLVGIDYDKLFETKIKSYLLNKEGIEFAKKLMFKLINQKQKLLQVTKSMKEMQAEIRVFDNRTRRIYNKRTNILASDLQWVVSFFKHILSVNGVL